MFISLTRANEDDNPSDGIFIGRPGFSFCAKKVTLIFGVFPSANFHKEK